MYVSNGVAVAFPLPEGESGRRVVLSVGEHSVYLDEGVSYRVENGEIVFASPPPEGAVIGFALKNAVKILDAGAVYEKLVAMQGFVAGMLDQGMAYLQECRELAVKVEADIREERALAEARFAALKDEFRGECRAAIEAAVAEFETRTQEQINRNLVEIRNKYKAVTEAAGGIEAARKEVEERLAAVSEMVTSFRDEKEAVLTECCVQAVDAVKVKIGEFRLELNGIEGNLNQRLERVPGVVEAFEKKHDEVVRLFADLRSVREEMSVEWARLEMVLARCEEIEGGQAKRVEVMGEIWNRVSRAGNDICDQAEALRAMVRQVKGE